MGANFPGGIENEHGGCDDICAEHAPGGSFLLPVCMFATWNIRAIPKGTQTRLPTLPFAHAHMCATVRRSLRKSYVNTVQSAPAECTKLGEATSTSTAVTPFWCSENRSKSSLCARHAAKGEWLRSPVPVWSFGICPFMASRNVKRLLFRMPSPPCAEIPHADAAVLGPGDQEGRGGVKAHRTAGYRGTVSVWNRPAQSTSSRVVASGGRRKLKRDIEK